MSQIQINDERKILIVDGVVQIGKYKGKFFTINVPKVIKTVLRIVGRT
jgi:hypothetical protein